MFDHPFYFDLLVAGLAANNHGRWLGYFPGKDRIVYGNVNIQPIDCPPIVVDDSASQSSDKENSAREEKERFHEDSEWKDDYEQEWL